MPIENIKKLTTLNFVRTNENFVRANENFVRIDFLNDVQNKPSGCVKDIKSIKIY